MGYKVNFKTVHHGLESEIKAIRKTIVKTITIEGQVWISVEAPVTQGVTIVRGALITLVWSSLKH